ncbi:hypothetical protein [Streptomyces sp. NBC_00878]|uniref:hypothetical protein n=1 Tax=Streptomyces sp. NBC_00878 TaxID=2975854 RepID=UPI00224CCF36|nr:hypothetical protein [Streptomyces sp. NBC_00878]MCX4904132.1 hypothetical protein [Streptomyces sp. NBC_00878]
MPMRRTVRVLSATAFTAAVLGTTVAAAAANSTAEVSPRTVAPGGTATVSVSCEPTGGAAPATIDATSKAFEHGTVQLHKATDKENAAGGTAYSGTARIAPAANFEEGTPDTPDTVVGSDGAVGKDDTAVGKDGETVGTDGVVGKDGETVGTDGVVGKDGETVGTDGVVGKDGETVGTDGAVGKDDEAVGNDSAAGKDHAVVAGESEWSVDGTCPTAPGGQGKQWSASFTVSRGGSEDGSHTGEVLRGVRAGEGGAFTDSTIALVTGGVLIAGAVGAAVHRLRRRESSSNG